MGGTERQTGSWKEKFVHEMAEYAINVIYLTLVFAAFTQYRRLVLAAHDIIYTNYWVAVIQALILGKVIMIGAVFRLGRSLEQRPLIFPPFTRLWSSLFWSSFSTLSSMPSRASGQETDSLVVSLSSLTGGRTNYSPDPW
jgi:hypothetical protein